MTVPPADKSKSSTTSANGVTTPPAAPTPAASVAAAASSVSSAASNLASNIASMPLPMAPASMTTPPANDANRYRLIPKGDWPPPIYVDPNATEQERHYIEYRWHSQWAWYDRRASSAKARYQQLQILVGIGSLIVPALISFVPPDSWLTALPGLDDTIRVATVLISLMVGAIAVLENVNKYGDNWRNFRGAAEELLREKSLYDVRSGPYRKTKSPFLLFVQRSEEIMTKQNGTFLQLAEEVQQQQQGQQPGQGQASPQTPVAQRATYTTTETLSTETFLEDTELTDTTTTTPPASTDTAAVNG